MAIVDLEFKAWVAQMESEFPQMFHDETASRVAMDFRLDIARMAFTAGRAAQRKAISHAAGEATTNPAEIGRKSVGGEAVMEIITKNGFKHLRLPDDKSLTSLLDFPEGTKFYAHPAHPPASAEVGRDALPSDDYQRGFHDGYERRHLEVLGALV